jgi:hypothetical protein
VRTYECPEKDGDIKRERERERGGDIRARGCVCALLGVQIKRGIERERERDTYVCLRIFICAQKHRHAYMCDVSTVVPRGRTRHAHRH